MIYACVLIFVYICICYTVFLTSSSLLPLCAGSDFEVVSGEVIIPPGVTSITVSIIINDDAIVEGNEDFLVAFTIIDNVEGGVVTTTTGTDTSTTVVTIQDNDSESQYKISKGCSTLSLYNGLPASYHYNCKPVGTYPVPCTVLLHVCTCIINRVFSGVTCYTCFVHCSNAL